MELPSNTVLAGATMSGKTYRSKEILRDLIKRKEIDYLIIMSPTLEISGDWDEFPVQQNPAKGMVVRKFTKNFVSQLQTLCEKQETIAKAREPMGKIMVVVDDCVHLPILKPKGYLATLSTKSRHLNISLMVLVQKITAVPRTFRLNCRYWYLFNAVNFSELERFNQELVPKKYQKVVATNLETIFNEKYTYILLDSFNPLLKERVRVNGDTRLLDL